MSTPEETDLAITVTDLTITDADSTVFTLSVQGGTNYTTDLNTITPVADFNGDLTVPVTVTDNSLEGNATSASFDLTVSVTAVNDLPTASDDGPFNALEGGSVTNATNLLTNDEDLDGDTITAVLVLGPSNASSFALNSDGTFTYTHDGSETTSDSFTYTANDAAGASIVAATVTIIITPVNDQPVITGQVLLSTPEETELAITVTDLTITDADSTVFTLAVQGGTNYTVNGNAITPVADFNGDLTVPVTVTDNSGELNATSTVFNLTVSVTGVNNQPVITGPA